MASTGVWFHTRYMRTGSPETPSSETLIDLQIGRTRNSSHLMSSAEPQWTLEQLHEHLQAAVDLEFWTIPFYMAAAYSIKDQGETAFQLILCNCSPARHVGTGSGSPVRVIRMALRM